MIGRRHQRLWAHGQFPSNPQGTRWTMATTAQICLQPASEWSQCLPCPSTGEVEGLLGGGQVFPGVQSQTQHPRTGLILNKTLTAELCCRCLPEWHPAGGGVKWKQQGPSRRKAWNLIRLHRLWEQAPITGSAWPEHLTSALWTPQTPADEMLSPPFSVRKTEACWEGEPGSLSKVTRLTGDWSISPSSAKG